MQTFKFILFILSVLSIMGISIAGSLITDVNRAALSCVLSVLAIIAISCLDWGKGKDDQGPFL